MTYIKKTRVLIVYVVTFFSLLIFATGQFVLRSGADDPQIQIANDTVSGLVAGYPASAITAGPGKTINKATLPFVLVYDQDGNPIAGSALYNGALPKIPVGVFAYVKKHGEHRVTWQPEENLRFATVIVPYKTESASGFVVSARLLKETENRIAKLGSLIFGGWVITMFFIIITSATGSHHLKRVFTKRKK